MNVSGWRGETYLYLCCAVNRKTMITLRRSSYEWLKIIPTIIHIPIIFWSTESHRIKPKAIYSVFSPHIRQTPDGSVAYESESLCLMRGSSIPQEMSVKVTKRPVEHLFDPVIRCYRRYPLTFSYTAKVKVKEKEQKWVNNDRVRLTVSPDIFRLAALQFSFDYADQFHRRAEERNTWGSTSSAHRETSLN